MRCEECQFDNPPDSLTCQKCQGKLYHAKLRVTIEDGEIQTHYLYPQKYSIGRGTENEIVIRDDSVSRLHAQIAYEDGSFVICDNESKNGSLLNDHHFKRRKLHDLDCIQLGNVVIHFYDEKHRASHLRQGMDTAEWVQREFFRYARNGQANITTDDLLLTMLDLAVSLIHADQAVILQFDVSRKLRFKIGKKQKGQTILENNLTDFDWNMIRNAMSRKAPEIVCSHDGSEGSDDDLFDTSA
ncbi:FHA domain-containing protein, partial [candidate division KSB1 bacterium]|nr:FHA domain-containing protein [candidate division KSB1 bacterium]NIR71585.1 FHA domain-containing protein [candidate division KSB1 bacterium]NIS27967.1 FHA domain-containing protein [candidate division KSB1 bacterium]NIT74849.1 FHA domain-containing protein [candidate division KSB1 bacterium]NIU28624.1 FHA domain-containing protein [candidate division KSB1 bacterium]